MTTPSSDEFAEQIDPPPRQTGGWRGFLPLGWVSEAFSSASLPDSIRRDHRFARRKRVKKLLPAMAASVFLAKPGAPDIRCRRFFSTFPEAPAS